MLNFKDKRIPIVIICLLTLLLMFTINAHAETTIKKQQIKTEIGNRTYNYIEEHPIVTVFYIGENETTGNKNGNKYLITYSTNQLEYHAVIKNRIMAKNQSEIYYIEVKDEKEMQKIIYGDLTDYEMKLTKAVGGYYNPVYQCVLHTDGILQTEYMTTEKGNTNIAPETIENYYVKKIHEREFKDQIKLINYTRAFKEILSLSIIVIPVLISYIAFRKGFALLLNIIRGV